MTTSRGPEPAAPVLPAYRETVAALFARESVRRYAAGPVRPELLDRIRVYGTELRPLIPDNRCACAVETVAGSSRELASALGSYAAIISARYFIAGRLAGTTRPLLDFGFRAEHLVIELTRLGLGSCWVGTLQHEAAARELAGAGPDERVPALLMFGKPATGVGGRLANRTLRTVVGATRRLAFDRFVFRDRYGNAFEPESELRFVLDCLHHAPSAGNARPWRVILRGPELLFCVDENAGYYRRMKLARWGYPELDAGIGMAHISIALAALGRPADWQWLDDSPDLRAALALPDPIRPVAAITAPDA